MMSYKGSRGMQKMLQTVKQMRAKKGKIYEKKLHNSYIVTILEMHRLGMTITDPSEIIWKGAAMAAQKKYIKAMDKVIK